ncbi:MULTISPECIES: hypothetical protein [Streptomycetaceae]|uniref:hypothetical protein n=1 Tax=Streptomycetaceae TaxID=2062 RepID=UPI00093EEA22|nr:hypothetical protein [Streptomyces sp. CB02056]OKI08816.1 hypothetical protein AMK13_10495 [Streptomyces sp. CB02056]
MHTPTPRDLDRGRPVLPTTATVLTAYHAELSATGLPASLVNDLVLAAGRTVIHTTGLTVHTTTPDGGQALVTLGPAAPHTGVRPVRPRGPESR